MASGFVYEPRSLWSTRTIDTTGAGFLPLDGVGLDFIPFKFNKEHFRNGSRYPIEVRRIAISGLNYLFAYNQPTALGIDNALGIINKAKITVAAPFRQRYSRFDVTLASFRPKAVSPPKSDAATNTDLYGAVRMNIDDDRPLVIPRTGSLEMQLTSPQDMRFNGTDILASQSLRSVPAGIVFHERGGLFAGSARSKMFALHISDNPKQSVYGGNGSQNDSNENLPFGFPPNCTAPNTDNGVKFWDPRHRISAREWDAQESTRSGSTQIIGSSVFMGQIEYNAAIAAAFSASRPVSPLSTRVGSKVRLVNCGSQAQWWRPGCPLALSHDSVTPALVYELPVPITLRNGDTLEVTAELPGPAYLEGFDPSISTRNAGRYQFGISFNGYAAIEG